MARPVTEAPKTQIYFTTHWSGANSVPRVRTVVRGERASRSIVNRMTALWSIWVVTSLILAGSGIKPVSTRSCGPEMAEPPEHTDRLVGASARPRGAGWTVLGPKRLKREFISQHRSGAFPVLRLRTVARGERASQSIVNRTTGVWSIWIVESLILAGLGLVLVSHKRVVPKSSNPAAHTDQDTVLSKYLFGLNGLYH